MGYDRRAGVPRLPQISAKPIPGCGCSLRAGDRHLPELIRSFLLPPNRAAAGLEPD
jgi:hypothetical protein